LYEFSSRSGSAAAGYSYNIQVRQGKEIFIQYYFESEPVALEADRDTETERVNIHVNRTWLCIIPERGLIKVSQEIRNPNI
jgi:hypothetical protein